MTYELDMEEAVRRAEEMLCGLTDESIKFYDFAAVIGLVIGTMAKEYEVDSMQLVQEIENIMVQIEELK